MGATITQQHGYLDASAERLRGAHIVFDKITVTGTEDLLMAAVLAEGETLMENCAREPEVADLAALLAAMGAKNISGSRRHNTRRSDRVQLQPGSPERRNRQAAGDWRARGYSWT